MIKTCPCGKTFKTKPSIIAKGGGKYCSKQCSADYRVGKKNPNWKGGKIEKSGMYYLRMPDHPLATSGGYISEHRYLVEQYYKKNNPGHPCLQEIDGERYLKPDVHVLHINNDTKDNRLSNLKVVSK